MPASSSDSPRNRKHSDNMDSESNEYSAKRRKKNCGACRRSKVKCDREEPCNRCVKLKLLCQYYEVPQNPTAEKLKELEQEVCRLKTLIPQSESPSHQFHDHVALASPAQTFIPDPSAMTVNSAGTGTALPVQASELDGLTQTTTNISDPGTVSSHHSSGVLTSYSAATAVTSGPVLSGRSESGLYPVPQTGFQPSTRRSRNRGAMMFRIRNEYLPDVVDVGILGDIEARQCFDCFFQGNNRLVPVFSPDYDSFDSIRQRSSFLFDTIIAFGYKVRIGSEHHGLFLHLRRRISDSLMLSLPSSSLETLQALLILVCYWEHSWIFMDLALSMARDLSLPEAVEDSMTVISTASMTGSTAADKELFRKARLCCAVYVLDQIYFVDGGKAATIFCLDTPRRIRCLVNHPDRTAIDIRLLAQVELNQIRSSVHFDLPSGQNFLDISETDITRSLRNARIDLDLWLADWTHIIEMDNQTRLDDREENAINQQNLRIQHKWAWASVNLRALSCMGAENLATMTPMQRQFIESAKLAAEEHLGLLLVGPEFVPGSSPESFSQRNISPYLASFKWATKFVWAKCAFSVLLTLRLAILLEDAFDHLMQLGLKAMNVAQQLKAVCGGQSQYFQILENSVSKFQKAVRDRRRGADGLQSREQSSSNDAEAEFRRYLPKEFSFDWNFPGLDLQYIPIDWDELFGDFGELMN
ncbi:hypothetical protein IWZ01DRAFT_263928 [Phyllosticta capitalensis]